MRLPTKPCSAGKVSWLNAQVRTDPRRICRGNRGPCQVFGLMLGFVQLRAGFAENTVLCAGSWAKCLGPRRPAQNRATLPRCMLGSGQVRAGFVEKTGSVLGFSAIVDARVRVARLRFSRENRAWFLSSMLGSAQVRARFAEKTLLRAV